MGRAWGAGRVGLAEVPPPRGSRVPEARTVKTLRRQQGLLLRGGYQQPEAAVAFWQACFPHLESDCLTLEKWFSQPHSPHAGFRSRSHTLWQPPGQFHPIQRPALAPRTPPGHSSPDPACPPEGLGRRHPETSRWVRRSSYTRADKQDPTWPAACRGHFCGATWRRACVLRE